MQEYRKEGFSYLLLLPPIFFIALQISVDRAKVHLEKVKRLLVKT